MIFPKKYMISADRAIPTAMITLSVPEGAVWVKVLPVVPVVET